MASMRTPTEPRVASAMRGATPPADAMRAAARQQQQGREQLQRCEATKQATAQPPPAAVLTLVIRVDAEVRKGCAGRREAQRGLSSSIGPLSYNTRARTLGGLSLHLVTGTSQETDQHL